MSEWLGRIRRAAPKLLGACALVAASACSANSDKQPEFHINKINETPPSELYITFETTCSTERRTPPNIDRSMTVVPFVEGRQYVLAHAEELAHRDCLQLVDSLSHNLNLPTSLGTSQFLIEANTESKLGCEIEHTSAGDMCRVISLPKLQDWQLQASGKSY